MTDEANTTMRLCAPPRDLGSRGIWFKDNPLDHPLPATLAQIIIVLVTFRLLHFLLKPLGQTKFTCHILGGIIMGPSLFGEHQVLRNKLFDLKDSPLWVTMGLLGTIYSMFLTAIKFDMSMVKRAKLSLKIGIPGLIITVAVSLGLGVPLASSIPGIKGGVFPFFVFSIISFSFLPDVAQALDELNLMNSELGQIAMFSVFVVEIIQWVFSNVQDIATKNSIIHGALTFFSFAGIVLLIVYGLRPLMVLIVKNTPEGREVKEIYIVAILLGALILAFVSDALGCFFLFGPIVFGLVIPDGPPLGATLVAKSEFVVSELLLPMFYFRTGYRTNILLLADDWKSFATLQSIFGASYVTKLVVVTVAALCCKISLRNSLLLGMMMNIRGITDMILFSRWKHIQLVDDRVYTQLVLSALIGNMIATSLIHFTYRAHIRLGPSLKGRRVKSIQAVQRNYPFDILCCIHNEQTIRNLTSLLEASNPTEASPICAYIIQAVELVGRAVPVLVPYKKKKEGDNQCGQINSLTHHMMQAFMNYSENSRGPVLIQAFTMIAPYKSMHESICRLVDDNIIPFVILPFHENHSAMVDANVTTAIRQFNKNMQEYSSCTVGILVERGLPGRLSVSHFSYNVAAFFIGGPDDREALALAARMLGNQNVVLTVYRILVTRKNGNCNEDEENQARLDESMVDEFKLSSLGNEGLNWRDIEVEDTEQLMDAIMNSQGDYDLVIVGRRHTESSMRDEEMSEFVHYPELGMIGDMLASTDFCGGMVNVLVLQDSKTLSRSYGSTRTDSSSKNLAK